MSAAATAATQRSTQRGTEVFVTFTAPCSVKALGVASDLENCMPWVWPPAGLTQRGALLPWPLLDISIHTQPTHPPTHQQPPHPTRQSSESQASAGFISHQRDCCCCCRAGRGCCKQVGAVCGSGRVALVSPSACSPTLAYSQARIQEAVGPSVPPAHLHLPGPAASLHVRAAQ